ncbi:MAG: chorismate synthase [Methanoregulaceae archaeon]|nr:chorismate synthase [Methanoregulaceae archaeon]
MNTFGRLFRCTTFGESHGPALGVVIDGCPPGIPLSGDDIQPALDRRRPGKDPLSSPRDEADRVEVLSGIFDGKTTGTPLTLVISNRDAQPAEYDDLKQIFRPGHADYTWHMKFGIRDYRGGGRASGRETVGRVAAGAVAAVCLRQAGIMVSGNIEEIHGVTDPTLREEEIRMAMDEGDSVGGIIKLTAKGCPPGLGDPVFGKLDALIAGALMGIGGVKGVEIGDGFSAARMKGSEHNDQIDRSGFLTNHAGGILGGISNGDEIRVRIAVKPTPSIRKLQKTITVSGEETTVSIPGRHDPCIVPRVLPVAEAMLSLVLIDALLAQQKYRNHNPEKE